MLTRRKFIAASGAAALAGGRAEAQCAPIDLGIPNIAQETQVWCWAAVAQQIIYWLRGEAPPQCALVAMANNAPPGYCCGGNPQCVVTGSLQQIQYLIAQFGGAYSQIAPPAGPQAVYETLSWGRPIIMAVQLSPYAGHVVVIRGMGCYGAEPVLNVNDPMRWNHFGEPVAFRQLVPYWSAAIVVG